MTEDKKPAQALTDDDRLEQIHTVIKNHMLASMGVGLIPLPVIDFLALTGVQLNMLNKMSKLYDVTFKKDMVKNIVSSLIGSGLPLPVSESVASMLKVIPLIGQTIGALALPALAGASTYALGKVFIQHFESGGTFLDFDPEKVKDYYAEQFQAGKLKAERMKKKDKSA